MGTVSELVPDAPDSMLLTDEQRLVRDTVREFMGEEIDPTPSSGGPGAMTHGLSRWSPRRCHGSGRRYRWR